MRIISREADAKIILRNIKDDKQVELAYSLALDTFGGVAEIVHKDGNSIVIRLNNQKPETIKNLQDKLFKSLDKDNIKCNITYMKNPSK